MGTPPERQFTGDRKEGVEELRKTRKGDLGEKGRLSLKKSRHQRKRKGSGEPRKQELAR